MNPQQIEEILRKISQGQMTVPAALDRLRDLPFEDLGFARIDHHRALRTGLPEIVFGEGKEPAQITPVVKGMVSRGGTVLVSRLSREKADLLLKEFPQAEYFSEARLLVAQKGERGSPPRGPITVLAAGTSDFPVAEEARITAAALGNEVFKIYDVGIAGLPRLLAEVPKIRQAAVLIVVAGMEGALPSVIAGLVEQPVIAVPTSVGYGASFSGITALLAMLNSCVPGVAVVNIDNGIGAAVAAHRINS